MTKEQSPGVTVDTYPMPKDGWTCFFCGEAFTTPGAARDHFGGDMFTLAGCQIKAGEERGLLMELRRAQDELTRYRAEDSDTDRAMHRMQADHITALRRAEEAGYNKGVTEQAAADSSRRSSRRHHWRLPRTLE